ncbi:MAG TPA: TRAP transporter large permease subunit [Burkholderiales bacterium]|nr:TRAP transporter large permease subunit [Burkholderiales bacterium]
MTNPEIALLMVGLFVSTIMLGFPIWVTLMAMGVFFGYYAMGDRIFALLTQNTFSILSNDVLTAVPLFLFMGYIVERANILDRLFFSIQIAARRIPGSMAVATLLTCAFFATATGIVGAVVTLMGLLAFPAMLKAGYDTRLSAGVVCAGGTLGILIPPSILLIVYAATAGLSVVQLYAGAFIPGFVLAGFYVAYVVVRVMLNPSLAPDLPEEQTNVPWQKVTVALLTSFFPLAVLIMSVLGAIVFGLATPTEAASVGALGSLALAAGYRALDFQRLKEAVYLTARTTAMVTYLFVGSWTFASIFAYLGGQELVEHAIGAMHLSRVEFLILAQFIIFLLGWPLEWTEIIIIFVPIFLPLLKVFDVDPLVFGILVALNIQTSFNTPPMAMSAYYLKGVAPPQVRLTQIFAGALPYVFMVFVTMALLYIFPGMATWLPKVLYSH